MSREHCTAAADGIACMARQYGVHSDSASTTVVSSEDRMLFRRRFKVMTQSSKRLKLIHKEL